MERERHTGRGETEKDQTTVVVLAHVTRSFIVGYALCACVGRHGNKAEADRVWMDTGFRGEAVRCLPGGGCQSSTLSVNLVDPTQESLNLSQAP